MLEQIVQKSPFFLIACARCFALIMTMPLFSMRTVSRTAKLAFTGFMAFILLPQIDYTSYQSYINVDGAFSLEYILILVGEALIGVIIGFFISIIFSAFSAAGQFFSFQMGFSASEVYDSLSQVENPLMGQFFNLIAMLIFLQNDWALNLFSRGLIASFKTLNSFLFLESMAREKFAFFLLKSLSSLFADALTISLPIIGSLLLVSITTGILSKAAPQMNLMSEGFPIMILFTFFIIFQIFEVLCNFFVSTFNESFVELENLFAYFTREK